MTTDLLASRGGEPEWHLLLTDPIEIVVARGHWLRIVDEMRAGGRWSPVNDAAIERLIVAYLIYDRSAAQVLDNGAIVASPKTRVPQYNLHLAVMKQTHDIAAVLESELMLSPRKRGKVPMKIARAASGPGPKVL